MSLQVPVACNHCGQVFYGPDFSSRIVADQRALGLFSRKLYEHITAKHPEVYERIALPIAEFQGMVFLSQFSSSAPALRKQVDISRWNVHQYTLSKRFRDDEIAAWVARVVPDLVTLAQMGDAAGIQRNLEGMLQSMRDQLEEPAKYDLAAIQKETASALTM